MIDKQHPSTPFAINISMSDYNMLKSSKTLSRTNEVDVASIQLREILDRDNFNLIIIDDPEILQRSTNLLKDWNSPRRSYFHFHYHAFGDVREEESGFPTTDTVKQLASIIDKSFSQGQDLIVSCIAGLSRSGAVAQAAIDYGFMDTGHHRTPNVDLYRRIKENLGILITPETSAFNQLEK